MNNSLFGGFAWTELYVRDLERGARYCEGVLGFSPRGAISYDGLTSLSFAQGDICLVLTGLERGASASGRSRFVEEQLKRHGSHVADVAIRTKDAEEAAGSARATTRQLGRLFGDSNKVASPLTQVLRERGGIRSRTLVLPGSLNHTLVELGSGESLLGWEAPIPTKGEASAAPDIATGIDHLAICVPELGPWRDLYEHGLGAALVHEEDIDTGKSAMQSFAVRLDGGATVVVTAPFGDKRSQITTFLEENGNASGAQHLALSVADILAAVDALGRNGVGFLDIPSTYYDDLLNRVGSTWYSLDALRERGVLADRDDDGELFQIFTEPIIEDNPLFGEFIERRGARGFGSGNIRALFDAKERDIANRAKQQR